MSMNGMKPGQTGWRMARAARVEAPAVLVSLRGGSEVLGAGEARELAAALVRGAELVEAIERGEA